MLKLLLFISAIVAGVAILVFAAYRSVKRRRECFSTRTPRSLSEWASENPSLPQDAIKKVLEAIGSALELDWQHLRPDDRFDGSLKPKGALLIDDDAADDVAEFVKENLGVVWNAEWQTVGEAISSIVPNLSVAPPTPTPRTTDTF